MPRHPHVVQPLAPEGERRQQDHPATQPSRTREEGPAIPPGGGTPGGPMHAYRAGRDVSVLSDQLPVPGLGFLPVNAFVLHAAEPVVVDTGLSLPGRGFMDVLGAVVDPPDVRWIWLTHPDRDHTGALFDLLEA